MQKSLWFLVLAAFAIVIIVGCGGRGMDSSTLTPASTGNSGATSGGSAGSASPGSGSSGGSGSAGSGNSGSGSGSGSNSSPAPSQFVYVATEFSTPEPGVAQTYNDQIFAFSINAQSGALTSIGSMQSDPVAMVRDPNNLSFYAAGFRDEVAIGYTVSTSGIPQIESVQGHFQTGIDIANTPDGKFVYVTGGGHVFNIYSAQQGNLTPAGQFPSDSNSGGTNVDPIVSPKGQFLFANSYDQSTSKTFIQTYRINADGSLTPSGSLNIGIKIAGKEGWGIDQSGSYLYAFNGFGTDTAIHIFHIDQSSGSLSEMPNSPQTLAIPSGGMFAISPQNTLYIASTNLLVAYAVNASDGSLRLVGTASSGSNVIGISVDRSGHFIYGLDYSTSSIFAFSTDANGSPQPVQDSPFPVGSQGQVNTLLAD